MPTTIVIPCHNEARRLRADEFHQFVAQHADVRFLFVNDGSSDETQSLLEKIVRSNPTRFAVLSLAKNSGKAEAIRQGVLQAVGCLESAGCLGSRLPSPQLSASALGAPFGRPQPPCEQPDNIGYWDADLATPLEAIPDFINVLNRREEISLVMGARIPLLGHGIHRRPIRRLLGRLFSRVTSFVLGLRVQDTQCGAKLFRATPEILGTFTRPFNSRWIFDVELLARLSSGKAEDRKQKAEGRRQKLNSIYELPLDRWQDVAGSKLKRGDFFKAVAELASIWWRDLRPGAAPFVPLSFGEAAAQTNFVTEQRRAA